MNSGNHMDALATLVGFVEAVAPHEAHPVWSAIEQLEAVVWTIDDEESAGRAELAEIERLRARITELRGAIAERLRAGHNDTCDKPKNGPSWDCSCGNDEIERAYYASAPGGSV